MRRGGLGGREGIEEKMVSFLDAAHRNAEQKTRETKQELELEEKLKCLFCFLRPIGIQKSLLRIEIEMSALACGGSNKSLSHPEH